MRRPIALAAAGWCAVVVVGAFVVWQAIDAAGRDLFGGDPSVRAEVPVGPVSPGPSSAAPPTGSPPSRTPSPSGSPSVTPAPGSGSATRSWHGAAGVVTARCSGTTITLQSASPGDGYAIEIDKRGGEQVRVEFRSGETEVRVEARCGDGQPWFSVEQRGDSSGSGS